METKLKKKRFLIGGVFILNNKNVITVFLIIERDFFILFCKLISLLSAIAGREILIFHLCSQSIIKLFLLCA